MKLPSGVSRISLAQHAELRYTGLPWEQTRRIRNAELPARYLGEERAKVGGDREIAPLVETLARQTGPAAVDLAAPHAAAEQQHGRRVTVIGSAIAVLRDGSTELRHRQHDDVGHAIAEILGEGGERRAEIAQARGELTLLGALAHVRVPTVGGSERDFEPAVGRGLHARSAGLHVVLRVEVRACGVGRAARVNDRERP